LFSFCEIRTLNSVLQKGDHMARSTIAVLAVVLAVSTVGCSEDEEYGSMLPPVTNNEISSLWRGTYSGTCRHSSRTSAYETRDIDLRIRDMGDNTVQVRAYLRPDFPASESGDMEGVVASATLLRIRRLVETSWYECNLNKAGRVITGSMNVYEAGSPEPAWLINQIDVLLDE